MSSKDWWIWKKLTGQHGNNGHDAARPILTGGEFTDKEIKKRYPRLSYDTIAIMRLIFQIEDMEKQINGLRISARSPVANQSKSENHKGLFKVVGADGEYIKYFKGDIVTYNNKTYIANKNIELGMGPLHEDAGWKEITAETVEGGEFN